jgi:antibiotic biosynthesis monooxygenase (ABM) superfamily enzyme
MLETRFLSPLLTHVPMAIATFIGNAISVSLVSWPLMKLAIVLLGWWLTPDPKQRARAEILGAGAIAALYAAEIVFFMLVY